MPLSQLWHGDSLAIPTTISCDNVDIILVCFINYVCAAVGSTPAISQVAAANRNRERDREIERESEGLRTWLVARFIAATWPKMVTEWVD